MKYSTGFSGQSGNYYTRSAQIQNARNATVTVQVDGRAGRYPSVFLRDNRIAKTFRIGEHHTLEGDFDLFNSLNSSAILTQGTTNGPNFGKLLTIIPARIFRIGAHWKF